MYVKYCENKPKSEYIVAEYIDFFEVSRNLQLFYGICSQPGATYHKYSEYFPTMSF